MTRLFPDNNPDETDWVLLYSSNRAYETEILKGILEEEDIPAIIVNKQDSAYVVIGDIEVYVPRQDMLKATQILNSFDEQK